MRRRFSIPAYVIFSLIAIGIFASIIQSINSYLIPIAVFGIIFLLYKFPPNRWTGPQGTNKTSSYKVNSREKKKPSPFRVIQGNKNLSDDDPPKFH